MSESIQSSGLPQDSESQESNQKDVVKYETYQKVLSEKKKRDEELRLAKEALNRLEQEKKALEESELLKKEDYKKLLEQRENELKEKSNKLSTIEAQINDSKKMRSFLSSLGTPLDEKYWGLIDLDKIALDPNTGKPDEALAKQYAEDFKKTYWEAINPSTGKIPNGAGGNQRVGLTYEQWAKLPVAEQKKRLHEVID